MLVVIAVLALASALRYYLVTWLGERVVADLRADVFAPPTTLGAAFYDTAKTGEIDLAAHRRHHADQVRGRRRRLDRAAQHHDVRRRRGHDGGDQPAACRCSCSSRFPLIVLPLVGFGRVVRRLSRARRTRSPMPPAMPRERSRRRAHLQAFTNERPARPRFDGRRRAAFEAARGATAARADADLVAIFLVFASVVVVLWFGAQDVMDGDMTPGTLGQFLLYAVFAAGALGDCPRCGARSAGGRRRRAPRRAARDRARDQRSRPIRCRCPCRRAARSRSSDVHFAYPTRAGRPALDGLSFRVAPGRDGRPRRPVRRRQEHDVLT